jgi:sodium-dependent dicarboxylate transporter 2/3/5
MIYLHPNDMGEKTQRSKLGSLFAIMGGPILFFIFLLVNPLHLESMACKVMAVASLMIYWWISEALPMPVVALIPLVLFPLMGISKISETALPYANEVIFLFMGGFMIGLGIEKWSLHKRIALSIVQFTGTGGNRIILGFILATGFISMWLSNTATTMMMYPIAMSVISVVHAQNGNDPKLRNFALCIMLSIAYASNFGGIATIIGTPPNVAYASFIAKKFEFDISFFSWMFVCFPVTILLLLSLQLVLTRMFPNGLKNDTSMHALVKKELIELGPMSIPEKRVMYIFLTTALLWIFRDLINKQELFRLDDNMIAVFGAILMFAIPAGSKENPSTKILEWKDTSKMAWGILLLFGGGITLANALEKAGLIGMLGNWLAGFSGGSLLVLILVVATLSIFISEVMSNVAQVIVFAPVVTGIAEAIQMDPLMLGIPMTLAASCASMMPMGTPPNAIVFSSGHIKLKEMLKAGFVMNIISIILIVLASYFLLPLAMAIIPHH